MKLLYCAAANSVHSVRWIQYFVERGHEVSWISLAPPGKEAEDLIPKTKFYQINPSPLADINGRFAFRHIPSAVRQAKKILKDTQPDLVHAHSIGTYGLVAALAGFHPLVFTVWGSDILLPRGLKKRLVQHILRQGDYVTYDGYNAEKKLIELGVEEKKIQQVRFGIDLTRFESLRGREEREGPLKVVSLRNLEPLYDVESAVRAAALVLEEAPETEFIIAGDGRERERLQDLAKELGLEKKVKFIGRYDPQTLPHILSEVDIYVSTSLSESGLAASTSEAMAAGLPLVVSDSGDNKVWIDPPTGGKGGFVVQPKNPEVLAEKILYLIKNPRARGEFGAYNRRITFQENNYHKEMEKMEEVYKRLLQK